MEIGFLKFDDIRWLGLLVLIPLFWALLSIVFKKVRAQIQEFANPEIVGQFSRIPSKKSRIFRKAIITLVLLLVICSFAALQYKGFDIISRKEHIGIIFCLDVSPSTRAEQVYFGKGGRLGAAKREIEAFVNQLTPGYRMGLLLFSGNILDSIPALTSDYESFLFNLRGADPGLISEQGTNLEWAIKKGVDMFDEKAKIRIMILVSDGEKEGDQDVPGALEYARENSVTIYTIGIGKEEALIPDLANPGEFLKDEQGQPLLTRPDEELLRDIANATGGEYVSYNEKEKLVKVLNEVINQAEVSSRAKVPQWKDVSHWLLLVAVFLVVLLWLVEGGLFKKT